MADTESQAPPPYIIKTTCIFLVLVLLVSSFVLVVGTTTANSSYQSVPGRIGHGGEYIQDHQENSTATDTQMTTATLRENIITIRSTLLEPDTRYNITLTVELSDGRKAIYTDTKITDGGEIRFTDPAFRSVESGRVAVFNDSGELFNASLTRVEERVSWMFGPTKGNVTVDTRFESGISEIWWNSAGSINRVIVKEQRSNQTHTTLQLVRQIEGTPSELLLVFGGTVSSDPVVAQFDGNETQANQTATNATDGGILGINPVVAIASGLITIAAILILVLFRRQISDEPSGGQQSLGQSSSSSNTFFGGSSGSGSVTVTIQPVNNHNGTVYPGQLDISAQKMNRQGGRNQPDYLGRSVNNSSSKLITWTPTDEEIQVQLEPGQWKITARDDGTIVAEKNIDVSASSSATETLPIEPYTVRAKVRDAARDNAPLAGATVTVHPDVGQDATGKTREDGQFLLPVTRAAERATIDIDHDGYQMESGNIEFPIDYDEGLPTVILSPATGSVKVIVAVDGKGLPGVPITVIPDDEQTKSRATERRERTSDDGSVTINDLPTGRYRINGSPSLQDVSARVEEKKLAVEQDTTRSVELPVITSYSLTPDHRQVIAALRERLNGLGSATNRDTAVPEYLGSVIEQVLTEVESIEDQSGVLIARDLSPDEVAHALLQAADEGLSAIEGAMNTTRNVKLFRACSSMEPATELWDGSFTLSDYANNVENGVDTERRRLRDRLQEVDGFLDDRWKDVGELGPARETYDRVKEMARSGETHSELVEAAIVIVALHLLDAIEALFDREPLLERLNATVY